MTTKTIRRASGILALFGGLAMTALVLTGCGGSSAHASATPQDRNFTVTAVPLLTHEMADANDYLNADFAAGGVLDGKEVYGFYPSTLVVNTGDTVNLTLVNPEDDDHTFTIPELGINIDMKAQTSTSTSFQANKAGIYTFVCAETEHSPFMWGQLIVQ